MDGTPVTRLTLADVIAPKALTEATLGGLRIATVAVDMAAPDPAPALVTGRPDLIFDFAAFVSSESEADFEKGYCVSLDGTRALF